MLTEGPVVPNLWALDRHGTLDAVCHNLSIDNPVACTRLHCLSLFRRRSENWDESELVTDDKQLQPNPTRDKR